MNLLFYENPSSKVFRFLMLILNIMLYWLHMLFFLKVKMPLAKHESH
jgi:hypothetical protein